MSKATVNLTLDLISRGYAPYNGHVEKVVYDSRKCRDGKPARWFVRVDGSKMLFVCLGCKAGCSLINPKGFQTMLPIPGLAVPVVAGVMPLISDDELLRIKRVLRLDEFMVVCRIQETKARELIARGEVDVLKGLPLRVTTDSVREYLERVRDEDC